MSKEFLFIPPISCLELIMFANEFITRLSVLMFSGICFVEGGHLSQRTQLFNFMEFLEMIDTTQDGCQLTLLAFVDICLVIISKWPSLSNGLL